MSCTGSAAAGPGRAASRPRQPPTIAGSLLVLVLLSACARAAVTTPTPHPVPSTLAASVGAEIRFALIGDVTAANVWALFDQKGYSYNNYAVRSAYWPRLYGLSVPDHQFVAVVASGTPAAVRQEGAFYTATAPLRPDLSWSDGSPFTADDAAFTVNAALEFHLGFDWQSYYNPAWLDHAEALDPHTVKFFFTQMPNVANWEYGALQGPVVQHGFWASKIAGPAALLPSAELVHQIETLNGTILNLQEQVNEVIAAASTAVGEQARQAQADLRRRQGNLDHAMNDLSKAQSAYDQALNEARAALYALDDADEPLLGAWQPVGGKGASTGGSHFVNETNAGFPGAPSRFRQAVYTSYATPEAALAALQKGGADIVLDPSPQPASEAVQPAMTSPTRSLRFLAFNGLSETWNDAALRRALACMLDQEALISALGGRASALASFVSPQESLWYDAHAVLPCGGLDAAARLMQAISFLKAAGYTWTQEPSGQNPGVGLTAASGRALPATQLMTPSSDDLRIAAAAYVQHQARLLGIPVTTATVTADTIDFAVFSSHRYDMALLGWNVSPFPGYLCDWFGVGKPLQYDSVRMTTDCGDLDATSDLDRARQQIAEMQSILAADVPIIPLYTSVLHEPYRNIAYPFSQVLDGLRGVYGAPGLAFPASP